MSQVTSVRRVLCGTGAEDVPELLVVNKTDLAPPEWLAVLRGSYPQARAGVCNNPVGAGRAACRSRRPAAPPGGRPARLPDRRAVTSLEQQSGAVHPVARVSVVIPVYGQEAFLPGAVACLQAQTLTDWECVVVDDGSPGDTRRALGDALDDPRVCLVVLPSNGGLGAALNRGLDLAAGPFVAYLPADDVWHRDHLTSLVAALEADPAAVLAVAGVRHHAGIHRAQDSPGRIPDEPLQLVQVLHRRGAERWIERSELTTDDLDRMLWNRLSERGSTVFTGQVSCEWVRHPAQRSAALREPWGGLNVYRSRYQVQEPLRLQSSRGSLHDEVELYADDRARPGTPRTSDGLRILLVGELAYNPDRVLALEERGHELHGLWTPDPGWYTTVGPLPFGHVAEVPRRDWRDAVRELQPDVVYAQLNWQAVPFAHEVLHAGLDLPFVWHLKEGPFHCRERGCWPQLVDLHRRADGVIYSTPELRDWFAATVSGVQRHTHVLDGDLPRRRLPGERSPLLSARDGQVHTVVPGRPLGPAPELVAELALHGVHVHLYGEKVAVQMRDWVNEVHRLAPGHLHLHPQVAPPDWVREFSQYDAGWLHDVRSSNRGDLHAATWEDLNYPARIATLAAAGVPAIQYDNTGCLVATQTLARAHDLGVFYKDASGLAAALRSTHRMQQLRDSVWHQRALFTYEAHVDELVTFLRQTRDQQRY